MPDEERELPKVYEPHEVEERWYPFWEENGFFHGEISPGEEPYTIVIPPPNVTGALHMGHALNNSLQDVLVRRERMLGRPTLWVPGTDHAGIATQNVVEKELAKEGRSRQDLGRAAFIERTWKWKEQYGGRISHQLKRLGCSCDWERERFTMDEGLSRAVREVFVRLYEQGLVYRGSYIINWCPRCHTALSDIEVEHHELEGRLWYVKYALKAGDGAPESVTVATTRPETMLGDTAVAVHPDDGRYRELIGSTVILPLVDREIPIVADRVVDPDFGTGAVKVTPAHDPTDFDIARRHGLPEVNVLTTDARISDEAPAKYRGMDRMQAREAVVEDLESQGLIVKVEDHLHAVGHCYRCDTVVEPYLSEQWFVKMKPLAEKAIAAVKDGRTSFTPKSWEQVYFEWMENIRDWCISRQIWWGHQIPAWYCDACAKVIVSREDPTACDGCGGPLRRDEDVLDTWFSSWLWPFSTLGWPEETDDLAYFYPTSALVTAHDIIYFWVARMIMAGLHFLDDVPFREVYITALIRDVYGKKMSKSRGNVIDPLETIEQYGCDALRFTLAAMATPGRDIFLSEERIEGYRNFANKIWNASRFVLMNLDDYDPAFVPSAGEFTLADRWVLSRVNGLVAAVDEAIGVYNFAKAAKLIYDFIWGEFCDWYVELAKERLYADDESDEARSARATAQHVLVGVLETALRLLHPVMPFITEEIWQKLPAGGVAGAGGKSADGGAVSEGGASAQGGASARGAGRPASIMIEPWPAADGSAVAPDIEREMTLIQAVTVAVRSIRSQLAISPKERLTALVCVSDPAHEAVLTRDSAYVRNLAGLNSMEVDREISAPHHSAIAVEMGVEVHVPVEGLIDINQEVARLTKEFSAVSAEKAKVEAKLADAKFTSNAPPPVVEKSRAKLEALADKADKLDRQLKGLAG